MGAIWLDGRHGHPSLLDVARSAIPGATAVAGWETNSRGSGGFDALMGVVVHHTACPASSSFAACRDYCSYGHQDAPVASMVLGRRGELSVHAAGAANHAGAGGPYSTSRGTIPTDGANGRTIGIEACNAGTGEAWPAAQLEAYEALVAAICAAYGLDPLRDVMLHATWAPSRKIDPAGPGPAPYCRAPAGTWDLPTFRDAVVTIETEEADDMAGWLYRDSRHAAVFVRGQGPALPVTTEELQGGGIAERLGPIVVGTHNGALESICQQAWGLTAAEAAKYLD